MALLCPLLYSQGPNYHITRIDNNQGLSESHVFCILQDRRGFMWFGTRDGLNRYDGYQMKVYRNDPDDERSLSNNYIYALMEDREGILWIGTRSGLNRFDPEFEVFSRFQNKKDDPTSLSMDTVFSISEDPEQETRVIWVTTTDGGLNALDPLTGHFRHFRFNSEDPHSLPSNDLEKVLAMNGRIWVGTGLGLCYSSVENPGHFTRITHDSVSSLCAGNPRSKQRDDIWFASGEGIFHVDLGPGVEQIKPVNIAPIDPNAGLSYACAQDADGLFWYGSSQGGLFSIEPDGTGLRNWQKDRLDQNSLPDNFVRAVLFDREGALWVGSFGNGIGKMSPTAFARNRATHEEVRSLLKDHAGGLWISKKTGLLHISPSGEIRQIAPDKLQGRNIRSLFEDSRGDIWMGTDLSGLIRFGPKERNLTTFMLKQPEGNQIDSIKCFIQSDPDTLWIGTATSLVRLSLNNPEAFVTFRPDASKEKSIRGDHVVSFYRRPGDPSQPLWIGTFDRGLNRMNLDQPGIFTNYQHQAGDSTSISANGIFSIHEDKAGILWLGTSGGFNRFDPVTEKSHAYFIRDGLPSNTIYSILPDEAGRMWLSTTKGLSCFDPRSDTFSNYDRHHGLPLEDFRRGSAHRDETGRLYFGGGGGLVSFDPADIKANPIAPKIAITSILLDNEELRPKIFVPHSPLSKSAMSTDRLNLSYTNRSLDLRFAALHFEAPEKNRYAYRLDDYDEGWVEKSSLDREASYMNLPPKTYTFRVKASNKDGVWSEETTLTVFVPTPPWLSLWAYVFYVLFIGGVITTYLSHQRRKLSHAHSINERLQQADRLKDKFNRDLERQVASRTEELQARNQELETLDRMVRVINREQDLQDVLESILEEVLTLIENAETGSVLLLDRRAHRVELVAARGYDPKILGGKMFTPEEMVARYTQDTQEIEEGIYLLHPDEHSPGEEHIASIPIPNTILAMALYLNDRLEGFIVLSNIETVNAYQDTDIRKLYRFRDHALTAIAKARVLNDLLRAQRDLVSAAHEAGMAEIVSEMLHNMGNVLNSVRTSGSLIQETARKNEWLFLLEKAQVFFAQEGKGIPSKYVSYMKRFAEFLEKGTTAIDKQHANLLREAERLDEGLQNILTMLNNQRVLSSSHKALIEVVDMNTIVEETVRRSCQRDIKMIEELSSLPPVSLEIHRFQRVFYFALENAQKSIARSKNGHPGCIRVKTYAHDGGVGLDICDNGAGLGDLDPEKIFGQSALTEWFGLHYCSNVVKEMSGRIEFGKAHNGHNRVTLWLPQKSEKSGS